MSNDNTPTPQAVDTTNVEDVRKALRTKLFSSNKPRRRRMTLFGAEIELEQPTFGSIMATRELGTEAERAADIFIKYAYVPGTKVKVFDKEDRDLILQWPFTEDLIEANQIIAEMTGVDLSDAEQEIQADPL